MRRILLLLLGLVAGLAACRDTNGTDGTRLTLRLTDAPGDVLEAVVTISGIYLQAGDDAGDGGGRVTLLSAPVTVDLLTLAGTFATLVDDVEVPSGTYAQLRFVIDGGYLKVEDPAGPRYFSTPDYAPSPQAGGELKCPSCSQSGLKVSFPGGIELGGGAQTIVVDFDVAETFGKEAGQSGMWVMRPSLKAVLPPQ